MPSLRVSCAPDSESVFSFCYCIPCPRYSCLCFCRRTHENLSLAGFLVPPSRIWLSPYIDSDFPTSYCFSFSIYFCVHYCGLPSVSVGVSLISRVCCITSSCILFPWYKPCSSVRMSCFFRRYSSLCYYWWTSVTWESRYASDTSRCTWHRIQISYQENMILEEVPRSCPPTSYSPDTFVFQLSFMQG